MNYKKAAIITGYNIIVVFVFLILFELAVRLFIPQIQPQGTSEEILKENRYYNSLGLKPNSSGSSNGALISIDKYGFRKNITPVDTSKESWLFLGDSVTMGIGVEDDSTFSAIIQKELIDINILNPSTIGWSVDDYKNAVNFFINENKNKLKISRIYIFYCLNDLYNSDISKEAPGGSLRNLFGDLLRFIRLNSRSFIYIKNFFSDRAKAYYNYDQQFYNEIRIEFENAVQTIFEIDNICKQHNIDLILITLPYEYQIRTGYDSIPPQKILIDNLSTHKINTYNMLYYFSIKEHNSNNLFLYGDGIHLSNLGHKIAAEFFINNIVKQ